MKFLKFLAVILSFFVFFWISKADLSISPLKHELTINAWDQRSEIIKVTNTDKTPITLYTSKEDFIAWDDTGNPTFIKPQDQKTESYTLSHWVELENESITLAPWETREIRFTVRVPENWEPGWHYWAIFFSPGAPNWAQVAIVQRLWVLVLINVPWDIRISWALTEFQIWEKNNNSLTQKSDFSNLPIYFETKFKNDWNTHLKPTWKIELIDENWETLKNIWKESIISPSWAFIWEKMVDYIPINDALWNVLPKSERKYISIWNWFWYQILKDDWKKVVEFKNLSDYYASKAAEKRAYLQFWEQIHSKTVNKKITANLSLSYEWKDKEKKDFKQSKTFMISYDEQYVWLNYYMIAFVILIIAWISYYIKVIVPKSKEKLKKDLLEEIKNNR